MDLIVTGAGLAIQDCRDVLRRAGFRVGGSLSDDDTCPVILGELPQLPSVALDLVEAGRHVLIAEPSALTPLQTGRLLSGRAPRQAVFLWSPCRYHPASRVMFGLARSEDVSWRPRMIRQTSLSTTAVEPSTAPWGILERLVMLLELAGSQPVAVTAAGSGGSTLASCDFVALSVQTNTAVCFLEIGLGEACERRELVLLAEGRRAFIDELDPLRAVHLANEASSGSWTQRPGGWSVMDLRQLAQVLCLAFLEATRRPAAAQAEADLWLRALSCWRAAETSLAERGARIEVSQALPARLRVIDGKGMRVSSALPSLRVVS